MVIGFWKRLISDLLDTIFLGFVGLLLSFVTGDLFYEIGSKGAWVGLIISFLYTGLLQTSLGHGQSLGKKILDIQVLAMDGSYLSFPKSFMRYGVLAFFVYNQDIAQLLGLGLGWPYYLYSVLVAFAFLGCTLMVPIHPLKRGLHDLVAGSLVVKKGTYSKKMLEVIWAKESRTSTAYSVWAASCLLVCVAGFFIWSKASQMPGMDKLFLLRNKVIQETAFGGVGVNLSTTFKSGSDSTTTLIISGYLPKKYFDGPEADQEAAKAALLAANVMKGTKPFDGIRVQTRKGYNIGLWSVNYSSGHDFKTDGTPVEDKK